MPQEKCVPLVLYVQKDGGTDQNFSHLRVKLSWVALFLSLKVDKIILPKGTAGVSQRNTCERGISLFNIAPQCQLFMMGYMPQYLKEMLNKANTMKEGREVLDKLEAERLKVLRVHKRGILQHHDPSLVENEIDALEGDGTNAQREREESGTEVSQINVEEPV